MRKIYFVLALVLSIINTGYTSQLLPGLSLKDVHALRYWQSENGILKEKILILNERKESISISFMIEHITSDIHSNLNLIKEIIDSSLGVVGGPWRISGHNYKIFYMPKLHDSISAKQKYLFRVFCNNSENAGSMHIYNPKPSGHFPNNRIIVTTGVDEMCGGSEDKYWWEYNSLFAVSGKKATIHFRLIPIKFNPKAKDEKCFIIYGDSSNPIAKGMPGGLKLIKANKGNLPVESKTVKSDNKEKWKVHTVTFPKLNKHYKDRGNYSVDFIVQTSKTTSPKFYYTDCSIMRGTRKGVFFLPLLVLPK